VSAEAQAEALLLCFAFSFASSLTELLSFRTRLLPAASLLPFLLRLYPDLPLCRSFRSVEGGVEGVTVCDAGCGTGSLSIPLALRVGTRRPV
jgi:2-polyprenyl-3-methyl-5-hydroxy-6-metoxy-1,4-benzoquinol methylase